MLKSSTNVSRANIRLFPRILWKLFSFSKCTRWSRQQLNNPLIENGRWCRGADGNRNGQRYIFFRWLLLINPDTSSRNGKPFSITNYPGRPLDYRATVNLRQRPRAFFPQHTASTFCVTIWYQSATAAAADGSVVSTAKPRTRSASVELIGAGEALYGRRCHHHPQSVGNRIRCDGQRWSWSFYFSPEEFSVKVCVLGNWWMCWW